MLLMQTFKLFLYMQEQKKTIQMKILPSALYKQQMCGIYI